MKKILIALTGSALLTTAALAAAPAEKSPKAYSSRGETQGMDPPAAASGQKVDPKSVKKAAGTESVGKAAPGKPEALKGKAKIDETAGMDPQQAGGQKAVKADAKKAAEKK